MSNTLDDLFKGFSNGESQQTDEGLEEYTEPKREPAVYELQPLETALEDVQGSDIKHDYVIARNNVNTLLNLTTSAVAEALKMAMETQHPRAFEAFNSLASTARLLSLDMLEVQMKLQKTLKEKPVKEETTVAQPEGDTEVKLSTLDIIKALKADKDFNPIIKDIKV